MESSLLFSSLFFSPHNCVYSMCSRGHWRSHEDERLRELVEKYGPHNCYAIAQKLQGRSDL
uniref:HTH myb-type domain-containing protein n=1 Tax=Solanum lycopersicum TaxID=4081 RepID=A0A3Q7IV36_SOLLC